jgi:Pectate lyase superfamily protein
MRRLVWQVACAIAIGCAYVNVVFLIASPADHFGANAAPTTKDNNSGCGAETSAQGINITCPPYSAVPNDNRDDSKAFQSAIDALPRVGGAIVIPAGTYLFNNPLVIRKPVRLTGAGPATILVHRNDLGTDGESNLIRIGGATEATTDVSISGLTLEGHQGEHLRTVLIRVVSNVKGVKIRNVFFRKASSSCVLITGNHISDVEISDNTADEFYEQFVELGSGGLSEIRIERNVVKTTRGHPKLGSTEPFGIVFEPVIGGEIRDVFIVGNQLSFEGMSKTELINTAGISLSHGLVSPYVYRRIFVRDNTIRTTGVGIRVQTLRDGKVSGPGFVVIAANRIDGAESYGIQVNNSGDAGYRDIVSITGNIVRGYGGQAHNRYDGIHLGGSSMSVEVTGNEILPVAERKGGYGRYGINIEPGIQNAVIRDNKIAGYMSGAILNKGASGGPVGK